MQMAETRLRQAIAFHQAGNFEKAQKLYKSVLKLAPKDPATLNLAGMSFLQSGKPNKAVDHLKSAVKLAPKSAQFRANLAQAMLAAEHSPASVLAVAEAALQRDSLNITARDVKGLALTKSNRLEEAEHLFRTLLSEDPANADLHRKLGSVLMHQSRLEDALVHFTSAAKTDPANPDNLIRLAQCRAMNGQPDLAAAGFAKHAGAFPNNPAVQHEFARLLFLVARYEEAMPFAERACRANPREMSWQLTYAGLLLKLGRIEDARLLLDKLDRAANGRWPEARLTLAEACFSTGDLERAWTYYKARFDADGSGLKRRIYNAPEWTNQPVKTLLVWADQGLGDTLQSAPVLLEIKDRVSNVILEVEPRFKTFFQAALPEVICRAFPDADPAQPEEARDYDAVICLSDLAGLQRPTLASFTNRAECPYRIDTLRAQELLARIDGARDKPLVGIAWRSRLLETYRARYYLSAEQVCPILQTDSAVFVKLQYTATHAELELLSNAGSGNFTALSGLDLLDDLIGAAALTAACDLVIAPNSSTADMAGILNVPVLRFGGATPKLTLGQSAPPWFVSAEFFQIDEKHPADAIVPALKAAMEATLASIDRGTRDQRIGL
ncbi:hypothetical protein GCM10009077_34690 [Roseibium denhamense]